MTRASEGLTHWYTRTGEPCYTVIGKNGKERDTNLRDARLLGLAVSVTGIIKQAAAPNLVHYLQEQAIMAVRKVIRTPHESEANWLKRVWHEAREHSRRAAEIGTNIHAAIEGHFEGQWPEEEYAPHVKAVADLLAGTFPGISFIAEKSFCHEIGYGGKTDLHSRAGKGLVLDVKSKDDISKSDIYDDHLMQLSAYRDGLGLPHAECGIVYVSTGTPGQVKLLMADEDELQRGWMMFKSLFNYWTVKNKFVWYPTPEGT